MTGIFRHRLHHPKLLLTNLLPNLQVNPIQTILSDNSYFVLEKMTVSSSTAAAVLKAATSPTSVSGPTPTPNRPMTGRGPKKNFLARQAALDAKLNVLRIRAEAEKKVQLEMSDEVIHNQ